MDGHTFLVHLDTWPSYLMDLLSLRSVGAVGVGICEDEDGDTL